MPVNDCFNCHLCPQLLARHSELEQSETKAQAALVTILSLTQITELKLLLDIGRQGHRFYDFVLTLLIASILMELCVGIIIIYIGNLHYYQSATADTAAASLCACCYYGGVGGYGTGCGCLDCLLCCCRGRLQAKSKRHGNYLSVHTGGGAGRSVEGAGPAAAVGVGVGGERSDGNAPLHPEADIDDDWGGVELGVGRRGRRLESEGFALERADTGIEAARVKVATAEVRIVRAGNYVRVVEDALRRSPGSAELEEELGRAREELAASRREKDELEAEQRLAEALQRRAFFAKEQREDRRERATFRRMSRWQHAATYLLYFVMLMNVFVTTFGISGGQHDSVIGIPLHHEASVTPVAGMHLAITDSVAPIHVHQIGVPAATTPAATKYDVIIGDHAAAMGNASYSKL
jgi:hypothetical protein